MAVSVQEDSILVISVAGCDGHIGAYLQPARVTDQPSYDIMLGTVPRIGIATVPGVCHDSRH